MEANELMSKIHNTKKRMPVILNGKDEKDWLNGQKIIPEDIQLIATEVI
jgi:putative SOS response-associated peptidase YedK